MHSVMCFKLPNEQTESGSDKSLLQQQVLSTSVSKTLYGEFANSRVNRHLMARVSKRLHELRIGRRLATNA